ncbi:hypothetical protein L2703_03290 [Shewanella basaltis]|uniref:hypothetical protein n=1 Tax=Shewanella basaltis TaxID=472183 RepID=UPI00200F1207|nr:hypothetical protein [Shewanella basaltis]MCL1112636.1 hypothetical protein [Shewanella basaltis]
MRENLIKSAIIGSVLGVVIGLSQIDSSGFGLIFSIFACIILGLVTVILIEDKPHLYSLSAIFFTSLFLLAFYGLKDGAIYTLGVAGLYGMLSVQMFQAVFTACGNVKFLVEKFINKK